MSDRNTGESVNPDTTVPDNPSYALSEDLNAVLVSLRALWLFERKNYLKRTRGAPDNLDTLPHIAWFDGGVGSDGKTYKSAWLPLLRFCFKHELDIVGYIRAVFQSWPWPNHQPHPRAFCTEKALSVWRSSQTTGRETFPDRLRSSFVRIGASINKQRLMHQIAIEDQLSETFRKLVFTALLGMHDEPPLVRLIVAIKYGIHELVRMLFYPAAVDYLTHRTEYDRALGGHLPEDLVEYARTELMPSLGYGDSHAS